MYKKWHCLSEWAKITKWKGEQPTHSDESQPNEFKCKKRDQKAVTDLSWKTWMDAEQIQKAGA